MLFATLTEDDSYTFFFDYKTREWLFGGLRFRDITRVMERIDTNLVGKLTLGKYVEELYESMFGLRISIEERKVSPLDELINNLVELNKELYMLKSSNKYLSLKEVEERYHCGFLELVEKYYNDIKENQDYSFVNIEKQNDDYIIRFNDELFLDIEPDEE